jgi:2-hydroxychromene-2-carboxylate isomerase
LQDPYRSPDSTAAAIGLLWCTSQSAELTRRYVDSAFARRWGGPLDLASAAAIGALIRDVGGDTRGWIDYAGAAGHAALEQTQQRLGEAGVFDVPAYLLGDEVFLGRQHLPMLQWILTGRRGEPPL